jgi:hypothetical protein
MDAALVAYAPLYVGKCRKPWREAYFRRRNSLTSKSGTLPHRVG